jgi:hypothetical protein
MHGELTPHVQSSDHHKVELGYIKLSFWNYMEFIIYTRHYQLRDSRAMP